MCFVVLSPRYVGEPPGEVKFNGVTIFGTTPPVQTHPGSSKQSNKLTLCVFRHFKKKSIFFRPHSLTLLNLLYPISPVSLNEANIFSKKLKGKLAVLARCSDDFSPVGCAVELERQRLLDNAVINF